MSVTPIDGGGTKDEHAERLRKMEELLPIAAKEAVLVARYTYLQYEAFIEEGFTKAQAIELLRGD